MFSFAYRIVSGVVQETTAEQADRVAAHMLGPRPHVDHTGHTSVRVLPGQVAAVVRGLRGQRQQTREELRLVREHGRLHRLHVSVSRRGCDLLQGRTLSSQYLLKS